MFVEKCQAILKITLIFYWTNFPSNLENICDQTAVTVSNRLNARQSEIFTELYSMFVEKCRSIAKSYRILSLGLHEVFCGNSVNISDCRAFSLFEAVTGSLITNYFVVCTSSKNSSTTTGQRSVRYAQVRIFRQLENQHNFWNRLTFLNKHLILSRSVKTPRGGGALPKKIG